MQIHDLETSCAIDAFDTVVCMHDLSFGSAWGGIDAPESQTIRDGMKYCYYAINIKEIDIQGNILVLGVPFGLRKICFLHQIQFVEFAEHNSGLNRSYYCEYGVSLWPSESGVWKKLQVV